MPYESNKEIDALIAEAFRGLNIKLFLNQDFGGNTPEKRKLIREALVKEAKALGIELSNQEQADLLDLSKPPQPKAFSVSISHCASHGGWIFSPSLNHLGFDIEVTDRMAEPIIVRICSPTERSSAPSPAHLWVAKEASFKALSFLPQLKTLSQIETSNWIPLKNNYWVFKSTFGEAHTAKGIAGPLNHLHIALVACA